MKTRYLVAMFVVGCMAMPARGQHTPGAELDDTPESAPPLVSGQDDAASPDWAPSPVMRRYRRGAHVPLGILLGGVGLLAGSLSGLAIGYGVTGCEGFRCDNVVALTLSVGVGTAIGTAGGVYLPGRWLGGQGSFGATLLGASLGAVPSALLLSVDNDAVITVGVLNLIVTPILGAFVGYRLSHSSAVHASRRTFHQEAWVVPMFGRTREGSLVSGLAGRF